MNKTSQLLLLASITTSVFDVSAAPPVTIDYLNNLTSPRITWSSESGDYSITLDGETAYYTYVKPDHYAEKNTAWNAILTYGPNLDHYLFKDTYLEHDEDTVISINSDFIGSDSGLENFGNIASISGNFINGMIENWGTIDTISGNFIQNNTEDSGFINHREGLIGNISGNFIGHQDHAIKIDTGKIKNVSGNFINNEGGIYSYEGNVENINANFIGNRKVSSPPLHFGEKHEGSFDAGTSTKPHPTAGFMAPSWPVKPPQRSLIPYGGAIYNEFDSTIKKISGNFINNYTQSDSKHEYALGGAVFSQSKNALTFSTDGKTYTFSGNYTKDQFRGKIYNAIYLMTNGNATQNLVFSTKGGGAWIINDNIEGGMVENPYHQNRYDISFIGDGVLNENQLTDQYVGINNDIVNADKVTVEGTTLRFRRYEHKDQSAHNWKGEGGFWTFLEADGSLNKTNPAAAVTSLSLKNAAFDIANGYMEKVRLNGYSAENGFLHLDVNVDNLMADLLDVNGNIEGMTELMVYPNAPKDIIGRSILFAQSANDTTGNANSFHVWRVYRSPYMFTTRFTDNGGNNKKWELVMINQKNDYAGVEPGDQPAPPAPPAPEPDPGVTPPAPPVPTPDPGQPDPNPGQPNPNPGQPNPNPGQPNQSTNGKIYVAPEVVGHQSMAAAAIAQNSSLLYNVMTKVGKNRIYCPGCGFYDYYWNGEPYHNLWVNSVYTSLSIKDHTDIDANIWGVEAGGDLQHDLYNKIGLFVSYRKGKYEMNGDGKRYYSSIDSQIDIVSYLAGLYYRFDKNNWFVFSSLYGGIQQADLKTDDGAKSDTDGIEFGGNLQIGYDYNLTNSVYLTPSLGVAYTQVNYDDATDNGGKNVKYGNLNQIELEAGVQLTKAFLTDNGYANIAVKPSVIRTIVGGDEIDIDGLGSVDTIDDATLGRIELSGRYGFTDSLSTYGWANYTFGSNYDATAVGLGLNYAW